jgi:solute carrier family 10 (sodium/bile acid cotransporter), member 7
MLSSSAGQTFHLVSDIARGADNRYAGWMKAYLRQHWFLTTLAILIVSGMTLGVLGYNSEVKPFADWVNPRWTTACVLLLMAFSLNSEHLWAAFRAPRPVLIACCTNYGLVPILGWLLMPVQQTADFRFGLMIAACVPCTTAAASVLTRKAKGNDAISLLATVATNLSCFVVTPLWLRWTTATSGELDTRKLMTDLVVAVLAPTVVGQLLRQPARLHEFAVRHKSAIGVVAQILIELLVFTAALRAGAAIHQMQSTTAAASVVDSAAVGLPLPPPVTGFAFVVVWGSCVLIHVVALVVGRWLARQTGSPPGDATAVGFAGSQKTLPIGLYIATDPQLFGQAYPFALFPMLLYHTSQLFIDTWFASRLAAKASEA